MDNKTAQEVIRDAISDIFQTSKTSANIDAIRIQDDLKSAGLEIAPIPQDAPKPPVQSRTPEIPDNSQHIASGYMEEKDCRSCGKPRTDPVHIQLGQESVRVARTIRIGTCGHPLAYGSHSAKVCLKCYKSSPRKPGRVKKVVRLGIGSGRFPLMLTADGVTKTITEWAVILGCHKTRIRYHMRGSVPFQEVYDHIKNNPQQRFGKTPLIKRQK